MQKYNILNTDTEESTETYNTHTEANKRVAELNNLLGRTVFVVNIIS